MHHSDLGQLLFSTFEEVIAEDGILRAGPGGAAAVYRRALNSNLPFVSQYNPTHQAKKRLRLVEPDQDPAVYEPFDASKFSFLRLPPTESMFLLSSDLAAVRIKPSEAPCDPRAAGTSEAFPHAVLVNVSPLFRPHALFVPNVAAMQPQYLTQPAINSVCHFSSKVGSTRGREIVVGYNSLAAYASVNHLHFQVYSIGGGSGIPQQLPLFALDGPIVCMLPLSAVADSAAAVVTRTPRTLVAVVRVVGGYMTALRIDVVAVECLRSPFNTESPHTATPVAQRSAVVGGGKGPTGHSGGDVGEYIDAACKRVCPSWSALESAAAIAAAAAAPLGPFDPAVIDEHAEHFGCAATAVPPEGCDGEAGLQREAVHCLVPPPGEEFRPISQLPGLAPLRATNASSEDDCARLPARLWGGLTKEAVEAAAAASRDAIRTDIVPLSDPVEADAAHGLLARVMGVIADVGHSFGTPLRLVPCVGADDEVTPTVKGDEGSTRGSASVGADADAQSGRRSHEVPHTVYVRGGVCGIYVPRRPQRDDITLGHLQTAMAEIGGVAICNSRGMFERTTGEVAAANLRAYSLTDLEMADFTKGVVAGVGSL